MIIDTNTVMQGLGLRTSDPKTLAYYDLLRKLAERAAIRFVKWPIIGVIGSIDYYNGSTNEYLTLNYPYTTNVTNVNVDNNGCFGQTATSFSGPDLVKGSDYAVVLDGNEGGGSGAQPGQLAKSGRLVMLNNSLFWFPSDFAWYRSSGGLGYRKPACWPAGYGNIKVTSDWGFQSNLIVSDISVSGTTATFTTTTNHGLYQQQPVTLYNAQPDDWNDDYTVLSIPSTTTFTATVSENFGALTQNGKLNTVPGDIKLAIITAVGQLRSTVKYGGPINSESGGKYNASANVGMDPMFGTVRQLLGPFRNISLGAFA